METTQNRPVPRSVAGLRRVADYLSLIRFSHTLFALPFALTAMLAAARGVPRLRDILLIAAALVTARSAAMAFNRLVDVEYDRRNPRTRHRHLPMGILSRRAVAVFMVVSAMLFFGVCALINPLALGLSAPALAIVLLYSYTKRVTDLSHFVLGLSLALAPMGAWVAIRSRFDAAPFWLSGAVLFWTAAFDITYSVQDYDFDLREGLHSLVARLGIRPALRVAALCQGVALMALAAFGMSIGFDRFYTIGFAIVCALLALQNVIILSGPPTPQRINVAFFYLNAAVSLTVMTAVALDLLV